MPVVTERETAALQTAVYAKLTVAQNLRLFARLENVADPDGTPAELKNAAQAGAGDLEQAFVRFLRDRGH